MTVNLEALTLAPEPASQTLSFPEPRLVARGITKRWRRRQPPLLDGVDLELRPGTIVSLVGRNGAGKTTLLRILAGLFMADSGTLEIDGFTPAGARREYHRRVGFAPAGQGGLYARLSVRDHLDYWARLALLRGADRRIAVATSLARFDLTSLAKSRVDRLSMGQRQRLRLAMAFLHGPNVVFLDEPRNSLDDEGLHSLAAALADFARQGGAALWCAPTTEGINVPVTAGYELEGGKLVRT